MSKLNTAAMIVKDNQIISTGINGTFPGHTECIEKWKSYYDEHIFKTRSNSTFDKWINTDQFRQLHREWSRKYEIHAEANCLRWLPPNDDNYVLYTLYSPCDLCAKDIVTHNIKTIYYKYLYKHGEEALNTLAEYGIKCISYN